MKQGFVLDILPSIADPVGKTLREKGAAAAFAEYRRLRAEKPDGYEFGEAELNRLGYELLKTGKPADAIAILRLNAEAFPASPNAQDSLREACETSGDRECAIAAAKKTLELLASDTKLPAGFRQALEQNARKTIEGEGKH
jgi:predicted Zn-dependent protease